MIVFLVSEIGLRSVPQNVAFHRVVNGANKELRGTQALILIVQLFNNMQALYLSIVIVQQSVARIQYKLGQIVGIGPRDGR